MTNLVKVLISNHQLSELTATSKAAYCRFATVCKDTADQDQVVAYSAIREVAPIDNKPLNYKQAMTSPYADQWQIVNDIEMQDL